ncbi:GNAT family N-acetyltransferase [Lentilitoribacter sp. EG35]|uniref:GNAT family N-acetyltransferase n=1 Tax=Lentilitoribacter sp. EG35 TaxID=3234192 RepID=UPI00345F9DDB
MIIHETERLLLETWELDDFDAFADIARNPDVMRYIAEGVPWSDSRIGWFMGLQKGFQTGLGYCNWKLTHRDSDELMGFCGLSPLQAVEATEISWWLKPEFWGRGYAREAAEHVLNAAFDKHALEKVVARAYSTNKRSVALIKKLGMKQDRILKSNDIGDVLLFSTHPDLAS